MIRNGLVGVVSLTLAAAIATGCGTGEDLGSISENLVPNKFSAWSKIQTKTFVSGPAIVVFNSLVEVFGTASDNKIWRSTSGNAWGVLAGATTFASKPSASTNANHLYLAAQGTDNRIYLNHGAGGPVQFQGWQAVSTDSFNSAPAVVAGINFVYLVARKSDQAFYLASNNVTNGYNVANWTAFSQIPNGTFISEPAAVVDGSGLRVIGRGGDSAYWSNLHHNGWSGWSQIPNGTFTTGPGVSSYGNFGHVDVFGLGGDSRVWFSSADGSVWNAVQAVPNGTFISAVTAWSGVNAFPQPIELAAMGGDNAYWRSTYTP